MVLPFKTIKLSSLTLTAYVNSSFPHEALSHLSFLKTCLALELFVETLEAVLRDEMIFLSFVTPKTIFLMPFQMNNSVAYTKYLPKIG